MKNEFLELTSTPMMHTSHIYRYSATKMVEPESLSTHIVDTQMMGYMIIVNLINNCNETIDRGIFLEKALHHDLEESMTGDVVRTLKYHNPKVLKELQNVAYEVAEEIYENYFKDTTGELFHLWFEAKEGKEGFILKLVDTLTVVNRVVKEVDFFKNLYFVRVAYEVRYYLKDLHEILKEKYLKNRFDEEGRIFTVESIEYLSSILEGAEEVLDKIISENQEIAINYRILDKSLLKEGK